MNKLRLSAALLTASLLAGCAHPVVAPPLSVADNDMACKEIMMGIAEAEGYQQAARSEDKFKLSYVLIAPAAVSVYNMNKAEKAALDRKEELMQLAKRKDCTK